MGIRTIVLLSGIGVSVAGTVSGCSSAEFSGAAIGRTAGEAPKKEAKSNEVDDSPTQMGEDAEGIETDGEVSGTDSTDSMDSDEASGTETDVTSVETKPATELPVKDPEPKVDPLTDQEKKEQCWFAVSGVPVGPGRSGTLQNLISITSVYHQIFPKTASGRPIGPGEIFDTAGGIFLGPRAEAYEWNKGGREIDAAIYWTFDGIAVAPDMHVIVKDGSGKVLVDLDGPYVAASGPWEPNATALLNSYKANADLPDWMKSYFKDRAKMEIVAELRAGRYVEVRAIPGGRCDD